jgi:hypothetical protein
LRRDHSGAQGIHAGEEGIAPGGAALHGDVVHEDCALVPDTVDVGRFANHQDARLHPADVITHDEENVGLLLWCLNYPGRTPRGSANPYFNPETGHEFSAVAGLTDNFINPYTNYQNGVDFHLDWGASQFLTKQFLVGAVGYVYNQLTGDSGSGDQVGAFKSRVVGVGPQVGYIFPLGDYQGYVNLKGYGEFDAHDRPSGYNAWLTLSISPPAPTPPASASPRIMMTK